MEEQMAYEGELVKLGNGRWARFQRCRIHNSGHQESDQTTLLVAVELDDEQQALLRAAEDSIETQVLGFRPMGASGAVPSLTTDTEHPAPSWPGDIGALH
jgi:hypothetical protein